VVSAPDGEEEFERRTKAVFDESVGNLDTHTRSQLAQARATALNEIAQRSSHRTWRIWAPITALAAAAVTGVAVMVSNRPQRSQPSSAFEDFDLLAREDLEMMQDLDFYVWLDEQGDWSS
jgi:hypothetical protein